MDFEDTLNTVKRRARIDLGEKLMDTAGEGEAGETIRRRAVKVIAFIDTFTPHLKRISIIS